VRPDCICPIRKRHDLSRTLRGVGRLCAGIGLFAVVAGCATRARGTAGTGASAKAAEDDDRKWELGPTGAAEPAASATPALPGLALSPPAPGDQAPFIGVVHDLSFGSAADASAVCSCLALTYGRPNSSKFKWRSGPRKFDKDTMAIAISSEGIACNMMVGGKEKTLAPASIAAIEHDGNDIVVVVEEATHGKPVARGALVKRPDPGASIAVRGLGGVPFGTPLGGGKGPCKIPLNE
jgi:hypothetical protein